MLKKIYNKRRKRRAFLKVDKHFSLQYTNKYFKLPNIDSKLYPERKVVVVGPDPIMIKFRRGSMLYNHYAKHRYFYRAIRWFIVDSYPGLLLSIFIYCFISFFFLLFLPFILPITLKFLTVDILIFLINLIKVVFDFFFITARIFFSFSAIFISFLFVNFMLIHLMPEIILLLAVILILSLQSWANNYYNSNFFKLLLVNSFGQKKVDFLESQSHSTRIIGARLGQLKQLYVLSFSWNIAFFAVFLAGLWSLFNSADTVHNFHLESLLNENQFSFIGLNDVLFGNHFYYDSFVFYSRFFILLVSLIFLLLFKNETFLDVKLQKIEFLVLILLGIIFSLLMVAASSFLSLFLIIEGLVMIMYILSAGGSLTSLYPISKIIRFRSVEGSLKYVITNAIAGSLFLLGSFLVILFSNGEIYFVNLNTLLSLDNPLGSLSLYSQFGILCGFILISSTFLFKIGAIPFHAWMADLYESSTLGVLSFFVLIPKMAILLTFINLYRFLFIHFPFIFFLFFVCVGLCSLVFGAILASKQVKISRLIAYSSVSQVGALLILLSLVGLNPNIPYALVMLFVISYAFVMLHFMSVLSSIKGSPALSSITLLKELPFVKSLPPFAQTAVAIFIFNLSGLPPFLGWVLKSSVLFSVLLLAFDSFSYFDSMSTFSSFELNTLYVFNNFFNSNFNDANFFSNIIFLMLLFFAIIIFMSLVVSVHYSIQLYKVSFSEINNLSSSYSTSTFSFSSTLLIGSLLFVVTVINFLTFFSIVSIFSWLQFVCFAF